MCIHVLGGKKKIENLTVIVSKFAISFRYLLVFHHSRKDGRFLLQISRFFSILRYHACTFSTTRSVNVTQLSYRWTTRRLLSTWQMSDYPRVVEPVLLPTHAHTHTHIHTQERAQKSARHNLSCRKLLDEYAGRANFARNKYTRNLNEGWRSLFRFRANITHCSLEECFYL